MAQKDARIRILENIIEEKEREISMLKEAGPIRNTDEPERIRTLEKKIIQLESLVEGLKEELLDLKAIVRKIMQQQEGRMEKTPRPQAPDILQSARTPREKAAKVESSVPKKPFQEPHMSGTQGRKSGEVLIMQTDGTLKPEPRQSEDMIVAGSRGIPRKKTSGRKGDIKEQEKKESKPLIYADDKDTVEIKRKKE
ncbi:MAG: hypothetical protein APR53_00665 [Methanoculleus sp. SDB]|nr:MAG: hypothetical protein APR53_00665 [Methanoculleus sp. SDB]